MLLTHKMTVPIQAIQRTKIRIARAITSAAVISISLLPSNARSAVTGVDFGECYSQLIRRTDHSFAQFICSCSVEYRNSFSSFDGLTEYCGNLYKSKLEAQIRNQNPASSTGSSDAACALSRAFGMGCAGDRRTSCRKVYDYLGNERIDCREY